MTELLYQPDESRGIREPSRAENDSHGVEARIAQVPRAGPPSLSPRAGRAETLAMFRANRPRGEGVPASARESQPTSTSIESLLAVGLCVIVALASMALTIAAGLLSAWAALGARPAVHLRED